MDVGYSVLKQQNTAINEMGLRPQPDSLKRLEWGKTSVL